MKFVLCIAAIAAMALSVQAQTARPVQTFFSDFGWAGQDYAHLSRHGNARSRRQNDLHRSRQACQFQGPSARRPDSDYARALRPRGSRSVIHQDDQQARNANLGDGEDGAENCAKATGAVISNGDTKKFDKWTIEAVPAYNLVRGPAAGQLFHPKGQGNGYVLTYGGKRFYFPGRHRSDSGNARAEEY